MDIDLLIPFFGNDRAVASLAGWIGSVAPAIAVMLVYAISYRGRVESSSIRRWGSFVVIFI